jgi:hypothetical protein
VDYIHRNPGALPYEGVTVQNTGMAPERSIETLNKEPVEASFDRWRSHTGSPFELLAPEAVWTIVGSSPLSKAYSRQEFLEQVISPLMPAHGNAVGSDCPWVLCRRGHGDHFVRGLGHDEG